MYSIPEALLVSVACPKLKFTSDGISSKPEYPPSELISHFSSLFHHSTPTLADLLKCEGSTHAVAANA